MNAIETLADLVDVMPVDAWTGDPVGSEDSPVDYEVIECLKTDDGFRALVRGPSGDIDFVCDDVTGTRIYRDQNYITLFETGENDGHWSIEQAPDGVLVASTNAWTREVISGWLYNGWDRDKLYGGLVKDGVPEDLATRFCDQACL